MARNKVHRGIQVAEKTTSLNNKCIEEKYRAGVLQSSSKYNHEIFLFTYDDVF